MKIRLGLIATVAGSCMLASAGASAADVPPMTMAAPVSVTVAPPATGFGWAGPYVGASGGAVLCGGVCWGVGSLQFGYNAVRNNLLFGVEAQVGRWFADPGLNPMIQGNARVGFILGQFVAYGEAGVGAYIEPWGNGPYYSFGGGVEFAAGDRLSVFGEVKAEHFFGPGIYRPRAEAGLNFHLGN